MKLTEAQFSQQVEDLLNLYHWKWCHFRPARTEKGWRTPLSGHKGFLDYIAVKSGRLLIFELKSDTGKVSPEQQCWLDELDRTLIPVFVWRPRDWEKIVKMLEPER